MKLLPAKGFSDQSLGANVEFPIEHQRLSCIENWWKTRSINHFPRSLSFHRDSSDANLFQTTFIISDNCIINQGLYWPNLFPQGTARKTMRNDFPSSEMLGFPACIDFADSTSMSRVFRINDRHEEAHRRNMREANTPITQTWLMKVGRKEGGRRALENCVIVVSNIDSAR